MGSSTAWELSKYQQNVLLLEQQDSIYTFGSSFGEARIQEVQVRKKMFWLNTKSCGVDKFETTLL